jgi:DNA-directed RNA polymerase specialized sigma24 family protein
VKVKPLDRPRAVRFFQKLKNGDEKMTNREIIDLRKLAMKLIRDEDAVQEVLFEIIRQNLTFQLAVNYIKLVAKGSAYKLNAKHTGRKTLDALNRPTLSLESTPADADDCTIIEIIEDETAINPTNEFEINEFIETLTDEEKMILNLINDGFTIREICKLKKISSKTISKILKSIRVKATSYFY